THTGDIGHEHGGRPHIDGGAVHVDGGTQGKAEPVHTLVHAQFFGGGGGHRQGAVAGAGDKGGDHRVLGRSEELCDPHPKNQHDHGVDHDHGNDRTVDHTGQFQQRYQCFCTGLGQHKRKQGKNTHRCIFQYALDDTKDQLDTAVHTTAQKQTQVLSVLVGTVDHVG